MKSRAVGHQRRMLFALALAAVVALSACGDTHRRSGLQAGGAAGDPNEAVAGAGTGSGSTGAGVAGAGTDAGGIDPAGGGGASPDPGAGGQAQSAAGMGGPFGPFEGGRGGAPALVACPASRPDGACSIEKLSCTYPNGSCWCDRGNWTCIACPESQPTTAGIPCDINVSMACRYGEVTCSCPALSGRGQGCGICPAAPPTSGSVCGNTTFECQYDANTCACGDDGRWQCATAACPVPPGPFSSINCVTPGRFTCRYPNEAQYCSCDPFNATSPVCSCPFELPTEGSACVVPGRWFDFSPPTCTYGSSTCECHDGTWKCMASCPLGPPTTGAACGSMLSCSYPAAICGCDGTKWTCQ
jgi:hypothetical protein